MKCELFWCISLSFVTGPTHYMYHDYHKYLTVVTSPWKLNSEVLQEPGSNWDSSAGKQDSAFLVPFFWSKLATMCIVCSIRKLHVHSVCPAFPHRLNNATGAISGWENEMGWTWVPPSLCCIPKPYWAPAALCELCFPEELTIHILLQIPLVIT